MGKDITKRKDVLTTGQVAQICNVAPRTVTKWFDNGQLKGYRIPGSRDRRIPVPELIRFMKAHNIPVTSILEAGKLKVLIIDANKENAATLAAALTTRAHYAVETAHNGFDAGAIAQRFTPNAVLINLLSSDIDAEQICKNIRANGDLAGTKVVAVVESLSESEVSALVRKGFDSVLTKNGDIAHIIKVIEETTAILY
jgi:excisionase family DNA binding protein